MGISTDMVIYMLVVRVDAIDEDAVELDVDTGIAGLGGPPRVPPIPGSPPSPPRMHRDEQPYLAHDGKHWNIGQFIDTFSHMVRDPKQRKELFRMMRSIRFICSVCGEDDPGLLNIHQVKPKGGYTIGNIDILCYRCHRRLHGRYDPYELGTKLYRIMLRSHQHDIGIPVSTRHVPSSRNRKDGSSYRPW
jgi:hypothetical protein